MSGLPSPIQSAVLDLSRPSWHGTGLFEELLSLITSAHPITSGKRDMLQILSVKASTFGDPKEVGLLCLMVHSYLCPQLN